MKIKKIISLVIASVMLLATMFSMVSCDGSTQDTGDRVGVSLYVVSKAGTKDARIISMDAIVVSGDHVTPMDVLLEGIAQKSIRDYEIQENGDIKTLVRINKHAAGSFDNDKVYYWECKVNNQVADSNTTKVNTYDKIEFTLVENTLRTISVTFKATYEARYLINNEKISDSGDKSELTLRHVLESKDNEGSVAASVMNIKYDTSENMITEIDGISNTENGKWVVYVNEELREEDISKIVLSNGDTVEFVFVEIEDTTSPEDTTVPGEE